MRKRLSGFLAFLLIGAVAPLAMAQEDAAKSLEVGDDAPPLTVSKFVKGEEVKKFDAGNVYVVEFWATWCGPCRATIPHLSKLQEKYKDENVIMIGVDAFEPDVAEVEPFIKEMGDKMNYRVALDDVPEGKQAQSGKMAVNWMQAANQNGIPTAFIVNQAGKVAWIGHPMSMDDVLEKVVAGKYDLDAAKKEAEEAAKKEAELAGQMTKIRGLLQKLQQAEGGDAIGEIVEQAEPIIKSNPALLAQFKMMAFSRVRASGDDAEIANFAASLLENEAVAENPQFLNFVAWTIVDPATPGEAGKKSLEVAHAAAEKAVAASDEGEAWMVLDTLALIEFKQGNVEKALEIQEKAIKQAGDAADEQPEMKERLQQYRDAAKKK